MTGGPPRRLSQALPDPGQRRPIRSIARVGSTGKCDLPSQMRIIFRSPCPVPVGTSVAASSRPFFCCDRACACYKPAARGVAAGHDAIGGRGGTGRRAGFRFQWRKSWGFESLRPHHLESVSSERGPGRGRRGACYAARMSHSGRAMLPDFAMLQMVDLGLPLSYQRRFRRFASVKLSVPRDLMKRGLPSSNLRSGFRTLTTTCHVVLHSRRRRLQGRADQIDNVPAFRPDQAGRRLTPCR